MTIIIILLIKHKLCIPRFVVDSPMTKATTSGGSICKRSFRVSVDKNACFQYSTKIRTIFSLLLTKFTIIIYLCIYFINLFINYIIINSVRYH